MTEAGTISKAQAKLIEDAGGDANGMTFEQMNNYIKNHNIACPNCGVTNFTDIRKFNLMFKTYQGVTEDDKNEVYLLLYIS